MKPYFYKIQEISTGRYYVGCQYGRNSDPSNFWKTYFTSNAYIKSQPKTGFSIIFIKERPDARLFEKRYLQKCYRLLGKERFITLLINRNIAPGILNTPESIAKANSDKKREKNSLAAINRLRNGTHNFLRNPHILTEIERKNISVRMKGNQLGKLVNRDTEYRKKQADAAKGNTNVRGKSWWNNGTDRKRSASPPGAEWVKGYRFEQNNERVEING